MVDVTKPILSVSCFCENGIETHLAKGSFLRFGTGHETLIRKGGVYFVKAQTVNACVRADGCTEKNREYKLTDPQETDAYKLKDSQETDAYKLKDSQETDAYKLKDSQKTDAYKLTDSQKKLMNTNWRILRKKLMSTNWRILRKKLMRTICPILRKKN